MENLDRESLEHTPTEKYFEIHNIIDQIEEIGVSKNLTSEEIHFRSQALIEKLLEHMQGDLNLELSGEVTEIYAEMSRENLIARVEKLSNIIECLAEGKPIEVGNGDAHYANSVTADLEGLRIAMSEAEVFGPVRVMVGLDVKALVGFTNEHIEVAEIDDNDFDLRDTALRKTYCRHITGEIRKEDIRYMVVRVPRKFFPREKLLKEELKYEGPYVFRGVRVSTGSVAGEAEELKKAA